MDLTKWGKAHAKNISSMLNDGESISGIYRGAKEMVNAYGMESIAYSIEIDGALKQLNSGSSQVAFKFAKIKEGEEIKLTRHCDPQGKTKFWDIDLVEVATPPSQAEEPFEEYLEKNDKSKGKKII